MFRILLAVKIALSAATVFGQFDIVGINKRLTDVESRVEELEANIAVWQAEIKAAKTALACPCKDGGKCICDARYCQCPNCPEHTQFPQAKADGCPNLTSEQVVRIYIENEAEISKIWADDPNEGTMKEAVCAWLKLHPDKIPKTKDTPATETAFTGVGREIIAFGASWCQYCPEAKRICEANGIPYYDVDEHPELARRYHADSLPALLSLVDGVMQEHHVGSTGFAAKIEKYRSRVGANAGGEFQSVSPPVSKSVTRYSGPNWTWPGNLRSHLQSEHGIDTNGLSDSQLRTVHDNLHNARTSGISGTARQTRTVRYTQPVRRVYRPTTYYTTGGSYCPSCAR